MKLFNLIFSIIIFALLGVFSTELSAQSSQIITEVIPVRGNCNMCKKRIEGAAQIKGVKLAEWTAETQSLKVIYKSDKTSKEEISKAVSAVGYDTGMMKGDSNAYKNLPHCCQYREVAPH